MVFRSRTGFVTACREHTCCSAGLDGVDVFAATGPVLCFTDARVGNSIENASVGFGTGCDGRVLGRNGGDEGEDHSGVLHFLWKVW